jgi:hypothetical protein
VRTKIIAIAALFASASAPAKSPRTTPLSQLPLGALTQELYTNDALGVRLHFPPGWIATPDPLQPTLFDPDPDNPLNQCTRLLLRFQAPANGAFSSWGVFFAIDPRCLSIGPFPHAVEEKDKLKKLADRFYELFKHSPFISPNGTDYLSDQTEQFVSILFEGKEPIDASGKVSAPSDASRIVNTYIQVIGSDRFWIGSASVSDDAGKEELAKYAKSDIWVKDH